MKITRLLYVALVTVTAVSCNFLDLEPSDSVPYDDYYKTEDDLQYAINGVYRQIASNDVYGDAMQGRMGLCADLGYCSYANDLNTIAFNQNSTTDLLVLNYWRRLYNSIKRANLLLANIDGAEASVEFKDRIRGEALFLRAYAYFMLVNKFNNIPLVLKVADDSSPSSTVVEQSPADKVYERIISDMESAAKLVPEVTEISGGGHVNRSAVYGILARVCLTMAGYPLQRTEMYAEAERYAREVITSGYHSLNPSYSQIFINYSQNLYDLKESIWEIEYYGDNTQYYTAGHVGRNTGIPSASDSPIGHCLGMIRSTANHYDMYDATDVRRDWNIGPYSYNEDGSHKMLSESDDKNIRYCAKFRREYEDVVSDSKMPTATAINFPVLRYADVLLMYAEAHFCNPDADAARDAEALECFNMVRRRGHGLDATLPDASVDYVMSSKDEFMSELRDERARELAYEMLRRDDLIRWGIYTQQMSFVWGTIPDSSPWKKYADIYFGSISSRDRLWPIPSDEMSVDGNLVQNPGW